MKRLLIISIIIAALSRGITATTGQSCTTMDDQPLSVCKISDELLEVTLTGRSSRLSVNLTEIRSINVNAFKDLQIQELDLYSDRSILNIDINDRAFTNVNVQRLILRGFSFTDTPDPFKPIRSVETLTLRGNSFPAFPTEFFAAFPQLQNLVIDRQCKLMDISPMSFSKVNGRLDYLALLDSISSIASNTFNKFNYLTYLTITKTQLGHLHADIFNGLESLQKLFLNDCGITSMDTTAFYGLPLKILELAHNKLTSISPKMLMNSIIERIHFGYNQLQEIPSDMFRTTRKLEQIYFNDNQIKVIKAGTFQISSHLLVLDLANNQINRIEPGAFDGLHTRDLYLENNFIEVLQQDTFRGAHINCSLVLEGNNIKTIEARALKTIQDDSAVTPFTLILPNSRKFSRTVPSHWMVRESLNHAITQHGRQTQDFYPRPTWQSKRRWMWFPTRG